VKRILLPGASDAATLHAFLHRSTGVPAEDYKSVLRSMGAAVPNRAGRFASPEGDKDFDWLTALLAIEPSSLRPILRVALAESTLSVAIMRALAATRHPDASLSLLRFAYRHRGAFRDECGNQIRVLGAHAVPGLLRAGSVKDPEAYKMTRYAAYQLDRIDCARPDRALKQSDLELRAEILHAYGEVRAPTAVPVVLSHSDDPSDKVRRSARWAMLRYVSGRPPKAVKRKLKLPGGRESDRAKALYLTYRQLATLALVQRLAEVLAGADAGARYDSARKSLLEESEPRFLAERLFAFFDKNREEKQNKQFELALEMAKKGELDDAILRFDQILGAHPFHPRRDIMAPFYYARARALLTGGHLLDSQILFTKALHLDPTAAFAKEANARRAFAEAVSDRDMSVESEWKLRRALSLSPQFEQARLALRSYERKLQQRLWVAGGVGGVIALGLLVGVAFIRRRLPW
jgi:hypothetical protein